LDLDLDLGLGLEEVGLLVELLGEEAAARFVGCFLTSEFDLDLSVNRLLEVVEEVLDFEIPVAVPVPPSRESGSASALRLDEEAEFVRFAA